MNPACAVVNEHACAQEDETQRVTVSEELELRRKWTFRRGDHTIVLVKKRLESAQHVYMKAFLWALYIEDYPDLLVEKSIGDRYKPDVVALNDARRPVFWGEAGATRGSKVRSILRRYPGTQLVLAKWDGNTEMLAKQYRAALKNLKLAQPVELLNFPEDAAQRLIDDHGEIHVQRKDVEIIRLNS